MANFDFAIEVILAHEGGLSDDPHDPGGITNFGITIGFMNSLDRTQTYFDHPAPTTRDDIKDMPLELAKVIYKYEIWNPGGYGVLRDNIVATKIFDCDVNMGKHWAGVLAQQSANELGAVLAVDGQLGPHSIAAIDRLDPQLFVAKMCDKMAERYQHIVDARPESAVFLKNWLKRAAWSG